MCCENELDMMFEKIQQDISIFSKTSIQQYIECAKELDLTARYFPVVESGFIVYRGKTILLTAVEDGTKLTINPL